MSETNVVESIIHTCWASSRVGAKIRAWHSRILVSICCRIEMEKVAVFPVPVSEYGVNY